MWCHKNRFVLFSDKKKCYKKAITNKLKQEKKVEIVGNSVEKYLKWNNMVDRDKNKVLMSQMFEILNVKIYIVFVRNILLMRCSSIARCIHRRCHCLRLIVFQFRNHSLDKKRRRWDTVSKKNNTEHKGKKLKRKTERNENL